MFENPFENPFQSPETVEASPELPERVYEPPLPGGWRPGLALSIVLIGLLAVLFAALVWT
jgi:hypothetical protein